MDEDVFSSEELSEVIEGDEVVITASEVKEDAIQEEDEGKLDVIGQTEDGTPVVTRESMVAQFGEEAVLASEAEAEISDEPIEVNLESDEVTTEAEVTTEDEEVEVTIGLPEKKVINTQTTVDVMGRTVVEEFYDNGTGQTVSIDGVKVN